MAGGDYRDLDAVSVEASPSDSHRNATKVGTKPDFTSKTFTGVDDWEPRVLIASVTLPIDGVKTSSAAVTYTMHVRLCSGLHWVVKKRYSEVRELHKSIGARVKHLRFPAKHFIRNHNSRILEQRRQGLEEYVTQLLAVRPFLLRELYNFLGVYVNIKNYDRAAKAADEVPREKRVIWISDHSRTVLTDASYDDSCHESELYFDTFQSAPAQLGNLVELCFHMGDDVATSENVLERLFITRNRLIEMRRGAVIPHEHKRTFAQLTERFYAFLVHFTNRSTTRDAAIIICMLRGFHCELDSLQDHLGLEKCCWEKAMMGEMKSGNVCTELPQANKEPTEDNTKVYSQPSNTLTKAAPNNFINEHDIQRDPEQFCSGSSGAVYRGTWMDIAVVVKYVNVRSSGEMRAFLQEGEIWLMTSHSNIVTYYGSCYISRPCFFVSEEAVNGTLPEFLYKQRCKGRLLVWRLMHGAAKGLQYLQANGIIHGDLKGNNIVVDSNEVAKLVDFGMSFVDGLTPTSARGPVRWTAPECLIRNQPRSFQSDTYSFGMSIIEAVTGKVPWGVNCVDDQIIDELAHRRFLPRPAELSDEQWKLVTSLCAIEPDQRCKLSDAVAQLEKFANAEAAVEYST